MSDEIPQLTTEEIQLAKELSTPSGYAKHRLGINLHPKQALVLNDLFSKRGSRLSVRCANEVGKTQTIATCAILYAIEIRKAMVVSTAGVFRQVAEQLIPSLKRFSHLFDKAQWDFQSSGIKKFDSRGKVWTDAYVGFSATSEHSFQGFHETADRPLLIIIDESQGVMPEIFRAAEDRCNPTWFMALGSPGDPAGVFYEMETSKAKHYTHHKITRFECLKEDGYWLDRADITRLIEKHGENNPFIRSTVFGEFSESVEGAMISLGEYDRCVEFKPRLILSDQHAALDFAAGRDKNVMAHRRGNFMEIKRKWVERDTMSAVGQFLALLTEAKKQHGLKPEEVSGDGDGLGLPMIHRIWEMDWHINEFHGGKEERFGLGYRNQISEAWGEGIKKIKACQWILPDDPDLKAQILGRKGRVNSSGQLEIERKEDYKKRCGGSPDEADAFFMAGMPAPSFSAFNLTKLAEERKGQEQYEDEEEQAGSMRRFC